MSDWLWGELGDLFDTDDGSLPTVIIRYTDRDALVAAAAWLLQAGRDVTNGGAEVTTRDGAVHALGSLPNAAQMVVDGAAEPFHCVVADVVIQGVRVPDLGLLVDPIGLELDYRMGREWNSRSLSAFFGLLRELSDRESAVTPKLGDHALPEESARFGLAWQRFADEGTA